MYFERSGTRKWNLPPSSYAQSSLPAALSRVNTLLMSDWQHSNQANLKQDQSTIINDQILIKVNKLSDSEESPTPEGVHQDGTEVSSVTMIERKGIQVGAPRHASPAHPFTRTALTRAVCSWSPRAVPCTTEQSTHTQHESRVLASCHTPIALHTICSTPAQHGGESRFWSTDAPTGNYDGIGANGQPIVPPAGFSWSHSLANITLEQPWESLFFIDRKVRVRARRVLRPPPPPM